MMEPLKKRGKWNIRNQTDVEDVDPKGMMNNPQVNKSQR